jgi:signal transduction histidine kinase
MVARHRLAILQGCRLAAACVAVAHLFWTAVPARSADAVPQFVLIIDDLGPDSPFSRELRAKIHATLDAEVPAGFTAQAEFLNSAQFSAPAHAAALQTYIAEKFRTRRISAIVAIGMAAMDLSVRLRSELGPGVPLVFAAFDEAHAKAASPPNSTGVVVSKRFEDLVKIARVLAPQVARIVLVGSPLDSQPHRRQYVRETSELAGRMQIDNFTNLPFRELASRVAGLPDDAVIVSLPLYEDASGHIHDPVEAMRVLAAVANRPIVTDAEYLLGAGAAAAVALSPTELGHDLGRLTARILNGASASAIPVETRDYSKTEFNAQALAQWNIREEALPAGSKVLFREVTIWDRYRWQLLSGLAVLLFQSAFIAALLLERRRRHVAERDSHQHLLEVTKMDRALTAGAMSSSIAHELNQPLTAIMNNAEAAAMLLNADPLDRDELKAIVADIRRDDERAANIIKHLRMLLRQSELKSEELVLNDVLTDSIALIESQANDNGVMLQADIPSAPVRVRADYVHIQQVILNLALNAIEAMREVPAERRRLQIRLLTKDGSTAVVSIADSGPGIPVEKMATIFNPFVTTKAEGTGLGLSIARTIVATYGGRIWAESKTGKGAVFNFSLNVVPATESTAKAA